jgi:hypothetical protein
LIPAVYVGDKKIAGRRELSAPRTWLAQLEYYFGSIVIAQNRQTIFKLVGEGFGAWRLARMKKSGALVQADETSLSD